jgi:putative membrane protein
MNMLVQWVLSAVALLVVAYVVPGIHVSGIMAALFAAVVIGLVNATLGVVLKVVTFPLTVVTLGIFWLVVNAVLLLVAAALSPGFSVDGFWAAFWGAIVLSLVSAVFGSLVGKKSEVKGR